MSSDTYQTIAKPSEGFFKEKGSKFYAFAFPVNSQEEALEQIENLKKEYHDSRHVCYAWRIGLEGEDWRVNDAGEPSHSAGDPILNAIRSKEVTNTLVVVIRYFGGTKLGIGGLIEAYRESASIALDKAKIIQKTETKTLTIRFNYDQTALIERTISQHDLKVVQSDYGADCLQILEIPLSEFGGIRDIFSNLGVLDE